MTPQELSEIDRKVAEAIGDDVTSPHEWPDYGEVLCCLCKVSLQNKDLPCVRNFSTDWNDAMYAAEKAGLFNSKTEGVTIIFHGEKHWSVLVGVLLIPDQTPQLALCRAILALKENP